MAGIFVRGLTGNKVNVFVDGVRYSNGAAARRRQHVPGSDRSDRPSSRIEVLRGPNSAQYGSDALGGSVQFLSQAPSLAAAEPGIGGTWAFGGQTAHQAAAATRRDLDLAPGRQFGMFGIAADARSATSAPATASTRTRRSPGSSACRRRGDARAPARHRLPADGGHVQGQLDADRAPVGDVATRAPGRTEGKRYDQLLGGDGNLISDLGDLSLDLFYARLERSRPRLVRPRHA